MRVEKKVPEIRFKGFSGEWGNKVLGETKTYYTDGNYGEAYPSNSDLTDSSNGIPFLRGSNLSRGSLSKVGANYITKEKHAELTSGTLVEDDIVIAVRGSLGALGYVKNKNVGWNINSQLAIIRTNKTELTGIFLIQYFLSGVGQWKILSKVSGSALKQLPIGQLKSIAVPITSIEEQTAIGNTFQKLDSLINQHQQKHDKLSNIKKAMLEKMFPKQGETTPEIRFKGFSVKWEEKELREICTYHSSSLTVNDAATNGVYPLFDANKCIGYTDKNIQDTDYISIIKDGSGVGRIRVLPKNSSFIATMGAIKTVKSDLHFLYCCLLRIDFSKHISGATIPHVYFRDYGSENCRVPIFEEQTAIGNYFQKLDTLISQHQNQIIKLNNIKQACLSKMFV